jgi:hypothetical protein
MCLQEKLRKKLIFWNLESYARKEFGIYSRNSAVQIRDSDTGPVPSKMLWIRKTVAGQVNLTFFHIFQSGHED